MQLHEDEGVWVRDWWAEPFKQVDSEKLSWAGLLSEWDAIETDFQHFYNLDLEDGVLDRRTWRWFKIRVLRLLEEDTKLARVLGLTTPTFTP